MHFLQEEALLTHLDLSLMSQSGLGRAWRELKVGLEPPDSSLGPAVLPAPPGCRQPSCKIQARHSQGTTNCSVSHKPTVMPALLMAGYWCLLVPALSFALVPVLSGLPAPTLVPVSALTLLPA